MATFDQAVMRGTLAARPAPSAGSAGRLYFATDDGADGVLYRDSGSAWETYTGTQAHTHDDRYYTESEVDTALAGKASTGHTHDDRYYTEAETDTLLAGKSNTGHTHDDQYYTEGEVDTFLAGKANTSHTHAAADLASGTLDLARLPVAADGESSATKVVRADDARLAGGGGGGHVIEDEGTPLTSRSALNFVGAGVAVTDDAANDATVVTIDGGGGAGSISVTDGITTVTGVTTLRFPLGSLTDEGGGQVYVDTSIAPAGEEIRLDAALGITKDGSDVVSLWENQAKGFYDFEQATVGNRPLWIDAVVNSEPVVRFDGSNDYLVAPVNAADFTELTIAIVVRVRNGSPTAGIFSWGNAPTTGAPFILMQHEAGTVKLYMNGGFRWTGIAHADNTSHLYLLTWSGATWNLYVDGAAQSAYVGGATEQATSTFLYLASGYNAQASVDIPYFGLYNEVLSAEGRTALTDALMTKYGIL